MTSVPEKPRPEDRRVVLETYPKGGGRLVVDGNDLSHLVRRVSVEAGIEPPVVVIELVGHVAVETTTTGGDRRLKLDDGASELLQKFGWTPPGEGQ